MTFASYPSVAARQAVQQCGWGLWKIRDQDGPAITQERRAIGGCNG